ncbi:MAG: FtsH protease activity modulator HflK [Enterobacteriaceae bacterium]
MSYNLKNTNKNKNYENSPPGLEEIFVSLYKKIKQFIESKNMQYNKNKKNKYLILFFIFTLLIWVLSGFYTIKEAERGVVLRFGKFNRLVYPGLNWKFSFIEVVKPVNVESVKELSASGMMLTSDENMVNVEMNVQYKVLDPKNYLFSVFNADESLRQATDSALRGVIGKYNMDKVLTEGRTIVRSDTHKIIEDIICPYNMGIRILDVNFQAARPPEKVKASFDDAIAAQENEQQYIREAEAYSNEVQPKAKGRAQRILEESKAYMVTTISEAQGEVQRFNKILPEYELYPEIIKKRLYIDTMEKILSKNKKILVDKKSNFNIFFYTNLNNDEKKKASEKIDKDILYVNTGLNNFSKKSNKKLEKDYNYNKKIYNERNKNSFREKNIREIMEN